MRKLMFAVSILVATSMLLAACSGTTPAQAPATPTASAPAPKIPIRWMVSTGPVMEPVVAGFNASQDRIELSLADPDGAADMVGPVGWNAVNTFHGQFLDMTPAIEATSLDTSIFPEDLLEMFRTEEGLMGLPYAISPAVMFYVPALFDQAGLSYPPAEYGGPYLMPDGTEKPWDWNTLAEIARLLTIDANGKNATGEGFDRNKIVQFGYSPQWQHVAHMAGFWGAGAADYYDPASLEAHVPEPARQAWQWYYEGMWGEQPFIPANTAATWPLFSSGDFLSSGKVAMVVGRSWATCCLTGFTAGGNEFQLAALPANPNDGQVHGCMDMDAFRIFKDTPHPNEALEVIVYMITVARLAPVTHALPAIEGQRAANLEVRSEQYPFVTSWQPLLDGIAYPDIPPVDGYMPNFVDAWLRLDTFGDLMTSTEGLDLEVEIASLESDLTAIFQK